MEYLLFSAQDEAVAANIKIFENYARSMPKVYRTLTDELVDPADIADGDLVAMIYAIPGERNGEVNKDAETTQWAKIHQCDNGDGYVIPKPLDEHMGGVVYDSIEESNTEWWANEII